MKNWKLYAADVYALAYYCWWFLEFFNVTLVLIYVFVNDQKFAWWGDVIYVCEFFSSMKCKLLWLNSISIIIFGLNEKSSNYFIYSNREFLSNKQKTQKLNFLIIMQHFDLT